MSETERITEKEVRNLQVYIGKRARHQTDKQVIDHIIKVNKKSPLSQEDWHKLIYPCGNNGDLAILKFVLSNIKSLKNVKDYMIHTVNRRDKDLEESRIEVLKELIKYLGEDKQECLDETMFNAGWFGQTKIVKFLIERGANKDYQYKNGMNLMECSKRVEEVFKDSSLREYLITL